jgi:hypothetical protein
MRARVSRDRRNMSPDLLRVESLEARALMAVVAGMPGAEDVVATSFLSAPTVQLCSCSDSGVKGDGITNALNPRLVGTAAPRSVVTLALDGGAQLGRTKANARGAWAFVSRRNQIPEGVQAIRVTSRDSTGAESQGSTSITIDRTKPTASIEVTGIDSFRVTFSQAVTGFTSALRGMTFSGRPVGGAPINLPFSSPQVRRLVGPIVFTPSEGGRVYDVSFPEFGPATGTYTLRLAAKGSKVVDAVAGNPLAANASASFTVA